MAEWTIAGKLPSFTVSSGAATEAVLRLVAGAPKAKLDMDVTGSDSVSGVSERGVASVQRALKLLALRSRSVRGSTPNRDSRVAGIEAWSYTR